MNSSHRCSKLNLLLPVMVMLLMSTHRTLRLFIKTSMPQESMVLRLLVSIKIRLTPFMQFYKKFINSHAELPSKSP
jgi:hypothetical protein